MKDFTSLGLPKPLMAALQRLKFETPTPIQAETIPLALEGKDILGSAQTGTGKTAAFGIPLVSKLLAEPKGIALVVAPTRELASQVLESIEGLLGHRSPIRTALLIGGDSMSKQFRQLKARPRLIVGTPGRINDHLERRSLNLSNTRYLVLDETDRMLDMGFSVQIDRILEYVPVERQTLLFSATLPKEIVKVANKYQTDPVRISIGSPTNPAKNIKQEVVHVGDHEKYDSLLDQLDQRVGSVIIFVKTRFGAEKMAVRLRKANHSCDAIHGNLKHAKRERVISAFRRQKHRIMVATDIAARGLDIPHIEHVINYDLPQCPEDYIHRIGRTARAGAEGEALCFVTPSERGKWKAIHRLMNPGAPMDDRPERSSRKPSGPPKRGRKPFRFKGKSSGEGKPYGERRGGGNGEGKSYGERRSSGSGEGKSYGERRSSGSGEGKSYGERRSSGSGEGKSYGERRSSGSGEGKNYGERKSYGERRGSGNGGGKNYGGGGNGRSNNRRRSGSQGGSRRPAAPQGS